MATSSRCHGPLTRYAKLRVAHAPGMPRTFSPPPLVSDPDKHHGTCLTHVPWGMPGSLTNGFLWSRWRGIRSRHSRRMRNPQFCVSGKRPMGCYWIMMNIIIMIMGKERDAVTVGFPPITHGCTENANNGSERLSFFVNGKHQLSKW